MIVRRFAESDAEAVSQLIRTTIEISNKKDYPEELMDELAEQIKQSKGSSTLHISIYNPINRQQVAFTSRTPIHVTPALYRWLCDKRMDGVLDFSVVEKK